ncbi:MAG: DnaB-like helicase C-terminal domain-containing protein [Planctomycetota bacterium]
MNGEALARLKADEGALLQSLRDVGAKVNGDKGHCHCPWHGEDKTGSLSVSEERGVFLWKCHVCEAGGTIVDVVARAEKLDDKAAVKRALELYGNGAGDTRRRAAKPAQAAKPPLIFKDLNEAAAAFERMTKGRCTRRDAYNGLDGLPVMVVFRLDLDSEGEKTFKPVHRNGTGWQLGDPPGKLPLFHLDKLALDSAAPVAVVEGEKKAEALDALGILATTSAHGAKSAGKTDWTPLAGRAVVIWPDRDPPGRDYARYVQGVLADLQPPAVVRTVDPVKAWPGLPEGGDVADVVTELDAEGKDDAAKRATVQAILDAAQEPPPVWAGGVDLWQQVAAVRLKDLSTFAPATFYKTGYTELDRALGGGFAAGEATSLFAPSAMGKSVFAVNLWLAQARHETPAGFLSLEMPEDSIWKLAVGIEAAIPRLHIRHQTMTTPEGAKFAETLAQLSGWPLYVLDRRRFPVDPQHHEAPTTQAVEAVIRDGVRHCGWKVVFLDYLAKVGPFDCDDLVRIPRLTNWVFDTAQRTGAHIVPLAQANKAAFGRQNGETGERGIALQDAKGSIEVVADMDNVVGLIRDDWNTGKPKDPVQMKAVVLKARQGPGGSVRLVFSKSTGRILEEAQNE